MNGLLNWHQDPRKICAEIIHSYDGVPGKGDVNVFELRLVLPFQNKSGCCCSSIRIPNNNIWLRSLRFRRIVSPMFLSRPKISLSRIFNYKQAKSMAPQTSFPALLRNLQKSYLHQFHQKMESLSSTSRTNCSSHTSKTWSFS
jgi:hypothetical protein